ncbi:MAG: DEAD/DEAH box helicase family protein [Candidatus Caenarcaniphilales bacterium]|nr:DEAD/DEAH box helicase family protein [Candidatus Caenarcaniphilales bacterium]
MQPIKQVLNSGLSYKRYKAANKKVTDPEALRTGFMREISKVYNSCVSQIKQEIKSFPSDQREERFRDLPKLQQNLKEIITRDFDISTKAGRLNLEAVLPKGYYITEPLEEAWTQTIKFFKENNADSMGWVSQPTGSGKTGFFMALAAALPEEHTVMVVVPNKTLNDQTLLKLHQACPNRTITYISSSKIKRKHSHFAVEGSIKDRKTKEKHKGNLVVVVDESLKSSRNLQKILDINPSLIIYDECHNYYLDKILSVRQALENHCRPFELALSATPDYLTTVPNKKKGGIPVKVGPATLYVNRGRTARENFGNCITNTHLMEAVQRGWIAPMRWFGLTLAESSEKHLAEVPQVERNGEIDFDIDKLSEVLGEEFDEILNSCWELYENTPWLQSENLQHFAVCSNVDQANRFAKFMTEHGLPFQAVLGTTPDNQRTTIFEEYSTRAIRGLSSVNVLKEGWDAPIAYICWNLRPTNSYVLYLQVIGRVARLFGQDPNKVAAIIDLPLSCKDHSPINLPILAGLTTVQSGQIVMAPKGLEVQKIKSNGKTITFNQLVDYTQFSPIKDIHKQFLAEFDMPEDAKQIEQMLRLNETKMNDEGLLDKTEFQETTGMKGMYHQKVVDKVREELNAKYGGHLSIKQVKERITRKLNDSALRALISGPLLTDPGYSENQNIQKKSGTAYPADAIIPILENLGIAKKTS